MYGDETQEAKGRAEKLNELLTQRHKLAVQCWHLMDELKVTQMPKPQQVIGDYP